MVVRGSLKRVGPGQHATNKGEVVHLAGLQDLCRPTSPCRRPPWDVHSLGLLFPEGCQGCHVGGPTHVTSGEAEALHGCEQQQV
jgi:hypothetical protein